LRYRFRQVGQPFLTVEIVHKFTQKWDAHFKSANDLVNHFDAPRAGVIPILIRLKNPLVRGKKSIVV
jgi:hypothetical protein